MNEALEEYKVPLRYLGNDYGSLRESDVRSISYVMTYHSAKGLDFDTVFLPQLAKGRTFWKDDEGIDRRLFFVVSHPAAPDPRIDETSILCRP